MRDISGLYAFCTNIVCTTQRFACAFKFNLGFFSALGAERILEDVIRFIRQKYPTIPVILDAKYNDIGNSATRYAWTAFKRYGAHVVTINGYLGRDTILPFIDDYPDHGAIVLVRTSNPSGGQVQNLGLDMGGYLYEQMASLAFLWDHDQQNTCRDQLGIVAGATNPADIATIRKIIGPNMPMLIPGVGKQGGDLDAAVIATVGSAGLGRFMINVSSGICHASRGDDYAEAAAHAAKQYHDAICRAHNTALENTM